MWQDTTFEIGDGVGRDGRDAGGYRGVQGAEELRMHPEGWGVCLASLGVSN